MNEGSVFEVQAGISGEDSQRWRWLYIGAVSPQCGWPVLHGELLGSERCGMTAPTKLTYRQALHGAAQLQAKGVTAVAVTFSAPTRHMIQLETFELIGTREAFRDALGVAVENPLDPHGAIVASFGR